MGTGRGLQEWPVGLKLRATWAAAAACTAACRISEPFRITGAVRGPPSFAKLGIDLNFSESLTDASLLPISVQLLPSAMPSRPAGSGKMSWTARLQKSSTFRRRKHLPSECLFVSGVSLLSKSFWPQATEDAGQEAPQAVGHAAGHLGRLTLRLPRDDTDVSWTSPLFSESGSQCPAGLQSRNT